MAQCVSCAVCLNLNPDHEQVARWKVNVTGSLTIEYILPFYFQELRTASQVCVFCSVIRNGIESMCRDEIDLGSLRCDRLRNFRDGKLGMGRIIIQDHAPLEIEIIDVEEGEEVPFVRLQFFSTCKVEVGGECRDKVGSKPLISDKFGAARDVAPIVSLNTHINLIQSWIDECLQSHPLCVTASTNPLPSRLLDISHSPRAVFLIETTTLQTSGIAPLYATLSHCWGSKRFIQTTVSSLASFKVGIPWDELPRTFQDAISVVEALGVNFIWVDSLCIIQDSRDDWKRESGLMASIYSNSYLNIAATGAADSTQGCLSTRRSQSKCVRIHEPDSGEQSERTDGIFVRKSLNTVHSFYTTVSRSETDVGEEEKIEAPLLLRAWAFQERYLAPRTLHFCSAELIMECHEGTRCECTGIDSISSNPLRNFDAASLDAWFMLVEEYSLLRLTYEGDRLAALLGVAKVFQKRYNCAYVHGIWARDVARGLLWNTTRYETRLTDEMHISASRRSQDIAPTWSWASMVLKDGMGIIFQVFTTILL